IKLRNGLVDVRLSTMPTPYGESVVMRLLGREAAKSSLSELGMGDHILTRMRRLLDRPHGLVLVTGPTGSGKTTTLYAALSELNSTETKIITVEDPIEYRLSGITQVQVNEKIGLDFTRVLRSTLRQDPDILLVGEIRDPETAQISMRAALTGHLVLSTLHTNDAAGTPMRLLDMGVPRYMIGMSLVAVIAQRLIRLICESCAHPENLSEAEDDWLSRQLDGKPVPRQCMVGHGCTHCNGMGYQGRVGVYEMLEMNPVLVDAMYHAEPSVFSGLAGQQMGGQTLRQQAVDLVLAGRTSVREAIRVSQYE
ncbi:MAG: type II/IV secretion system protein, partial [Pseudomonadota bacterium]|nr:type II/IV secretion system protein [Pseudomonadota bacterium]